MLILSALSNATLETFGILGGLIVAWTTIFFRLYKTLCWSMSGLVRLVFFFVGFFKKLRSAKFFSQFFKKIWRPHLNAVQLKKKFWRVNIINLRSTGSGCSATLLKKNLKGDRLSPRHLADAGRDVLWKVSTAAVRRRA